MFTVRFFLITAVLSSSKVLSGQLNCSSHAERPKDLESRSALECLFVGECPEELERAEDQVVSIIGIETSLANTDEAEAPIGDRADPDVASHVMGGEAAVVCV